MATSYDQARVGCVGAAFEQYAQWKTVVGPDGTGSEIEVAQQLGKSGLSEQERLIAGLLAPAHLLDVVKNFLLFMQVGGQTIKSVCRYQQYRARTGPSPGSRPARSGGSTASTTSAAASSGTPRARARA